MLLAMAEYAIGVNFTSPRAKPVEPPFDSVRAFESLLEVEPLRNGAAASVQRLGLRITGHGGGDWSMLMTGDDVVAAEPGLHAACGTVLECDVDSFAALANGSLDVEPALDTGRIRVVANGADSPSLVQALRSVVETCQPRVAAT
jgi:hypothetical protein